MSKQVVIETRKNGEVKIETSYDFCPLLKGKKQYEEVVVGNKTYYWVRVASDVDTSNINYSRNTNNRYAKKMALKFKLQAERDARIARMREMAEREEEFTFSSQDIESGMLLQSIITRKSKSLVV